MILDKPFVDITLNDIEGLKNDEISEGRDIDYKLLLDLDSDDKKRELLSDISSFANSNGGFLIYGIQEDNGIIQDICGFEISNLDEMKLKIENLLRTSIEPRISKVEIKSLDLQNNLKVLILKIPKSWSAPHVVKHKKHWKFYSRNSAGKYPFDVSELRNAFMQSESITDKVEKIRLERLSDIVSGNSFRKFKGRTLVCLHIFPFQAFDPGFSIELPYNMNTILDLSTITRQSYSSEFNFKGFMTYAITDHKSEYVSAYTQLFRKGYIEAVTDSYSDRLPDGQFNFTIKSFEMKIIDYTNRCLNNLHVLDVEFPVYVAVSMFGFLGAEIYYSDDYGSPHAHDFHKLREDQLIFSPISINSLEEPLETQLKPLFDALWNGFGIYQSLSYDEKGKFKK